MIKAIETVYKGYKFRSRLEAKWAVFLDELGLSWEYEPEGFEMSDETRYLPDFWVHDLDLYIEVKPDVFYQKYRPIRVYLAGKINYKCDEQTSLYDNWRSTLIETDYKHTIWDHFTVGAGPTFNPLHFYKNFFYSGPEISSPFGHGTCNWEGGLELFEKHKTAIRNSDIIFCWIDTMDSYGSMLELGLADDIVPSFLGVYDRLDVDEFGFISQSVNFSGLFETAKEAFECLVARRFPINRELDKIIKFHIESGKDISVLCGDPVEFDFFTLKNTYPCIGNLEMADFFNPFQDFDFAQAAQKARQYRFGRIA